MMFVDFPGRKPAARTFAVKDSIDVQGMRTGLGSRAYQDAAPAAANAECVQRLLDAGWHLVGKTVMHELAFGVTGLNDWSGTPLNPQAPDRVPGGSSSGSASAVAAGVVDLALGTDTGGSIRVPAACCGVFGLKPSFGLVSRRGVHPAGTSLDCAGPFASSMDVLIAAMDCLSDEFKSGASATGGPRVAVVGTEASAEVAAALELALGRSGWSVNRAALAHLDDAYQAGLHIINAETASAYQHLLGRGLLGADIEDRLGRAATTSAEQVAAAEQVRTRFSAAVDALLDGSDLIALPTLPELPPRIADVRRGLPVLTMTSLVRPFNLSGHPALTVPIPVAGTSIKAGLQLVGRKGADRQLCLWGRQLEAALATS